MSTIRAGAVLSAKDVSGVAAFYAAVTGLEIAHAEDDHVVLEADAYQLVVRSIPEPLAASIEVSTPPRRRAEVPVEMVFVVSSLAAVRELAPAAGGGLNPREREWELQGQRVCDGHDPEGNIVQFRSHEHRGHR
jgi:catechol 2,3-dioxygenase-like lactoylglutathione lyase family enzyme